MSDESKRLTNDELFTILPFQFYETIAATIANFLHIHFIGKENHGTKSLIWYEEKFAPNVKHDDE